MAETYGELVGFGLESWQFWVGPRAACALLGVGRMRGGESCRESKAKATPWAATVR